MVALRQPALAARPRHWRTQPYAADLEDFRHWCKKFGREWLPADPKTIGLYLGARADELSLATLERRLAAIATLHKEEGYESPASVAEGPLRKIWKGLVREKTRRQDGAPPLMVQDLRSIIEHLPRYSASDDGHQVRRAISIGIRYLGKVGRERL